MDLEQSDDAEGGDNTQLGVTCVYEADIVAYGTPLNNISYTSLVNWNISKAIEKNPEINLKEALIVAQQKLDNFSFENRVDEAIQPEERYLTCALLAWQNLGNTDMEPLYEFVTQGVHLDKQENHMHKVVPESVDTSDTKSSCDLYEIPSTNDSNSTAAPVINIPMRPTIVMRVEEERSCHDCSRNDNNKSKRPNVKGKLTEALCKESACTERLQKLDSSSAALRKRAAALAKREAERVELLERAEAAWKELELGYQRRLKLTEEKTISLSKQIEKLEEENENYQTVCTKLTNCLRGSGSAAEEERKKLIELDKTVCNRAVQRHRIADQAASYDSALADMQCKAAQLDRDLLFKEEQTQRKLAMLQNQIESARLISYELERAMRLDMTSLNEQTQDIAKEIVEEDAKIEDTQKEVEELFELKNMMLSDLEGCKLACDGKMQKGLEELKRKRQELFVLKQRVLECQCKLPNDMSVQVKRTPSLAMLCRCRPDEKSPELCSCTSLRTSLMSNLLKDLFSGLQTELGMGVLMPCELLKCLEDKHNWDKTTTLKTKLRDYFSKLLLGELDIAIATSIENYHAKWVGTTCADRTMLFKDALETQDMICDAKKRRDERTIEKRALELAATLADQLFKEKTEKFLSSNPPPCTCAKGTGVYSCAVPRCTATGKRNANIIRTDDVLSTYWMKTQKDVTNLRSEIENLKKDSINKDDLQVMAMKLENIVKNTSNIEDAYVTKLPKEEFIEEDFKRTKDLVGSSNKCRLVTITKKDSKRKISSKAKTSAPSTRLNKNNTLPNSNPKFRNVQAKVRTRQTLAVNVCLCGTDNTKVRESSEAVQNFQRSLSWKKNSVSEHNEKLSIEPVSPLPSKEKNKSDNINIDSKSISLCEDGCGCFKKLPSNTSIKKLLSNLMKWQSDYSALHKTLDSSTSYENNQILLNNVHKSCFTANDNIHSDSNKGRKDCNPKIEDSTFLDNLHNNISINTDKVNISLHCDIDTSKNVTTLPKSTESEYMGAVNLDKSSENLHICEGNNKLSNDENLKVNIIPPDKFKNYEEPLYYNRNIENFLTNIPKYTAPTEAISGLSKDTENCDDLGNKINTESIHSRNYKNDYNVQFLGLTIVGESKTPYYDNKSSNNIDNIPLLETIDNGQNTCLHKIYNKNNGLNLNESLPSFILNNNTNLKNINSDNLEKLKLKENVDLDEENNKSLCTDQTSNCICCNMLYTDLEANTFQLLEEHFTSKVKEFQSSKCKSNCINTNNEQELLTSMFKKIKATISENISKVACKCVQEGRLYNSWNRAYTLLQEYLKIKIKRAQCGCDKNWKSDIDVNLNEEIHKKILSNICNLIETDFNKIKNVCTCNKSRNSSVIKCKEVVDGYKEEITQNFILAVDHSIFTEPKTPMLSQNILNKSEIEFNEYSKEIGITKNDISAQLSEQICTESKSCGSINESINTQTVNDHCYYYNIVSECDCIENNPNVKILRRNELLVSCCPQIISSTNKDIFYYNKFSDKSKSLNFMTICTPLDKIDQKEIVKTDKSSPLDKKNYNIDEKSLVTNYNTSDCNKPINHIVDSVLECNEKVGTKHDEVLSLPYVGCTVDCSCDDNVGSTICRRAFLNANNDKIQNMYNTFIKKQVPSELCYGKLSSHFIRAKEKISSYNISDIGKMTTDIVDNNVEQSYNANCTSACVTNELSESNELILKHSSRKHFNFESVTTNTNSACNFGLAETKHPQNIKSIDLQNKYQPIQPIQVISSFNNKVLDMSLSSVNVNLSMDTEAGFVKKRSETEITLDSPEQISEIYSICECRKVPLCHVKMLVDGIENTLMNKKCTCSFSSNVCPIHKF